MTSPRRWGLDQLAPPLAAPTKPDPTCLSFHQEAIVRNWKHWLEDRMTHRRPVDRFFDHAIEWVYENGAGEVLELGPGHSKDIAEKLSLKGILVQQADINAEMTGVTDISHIWERLQELPFRDGRFHAVLARETMEHVDDIYAMVDEVHRIIRPGGRFWFSTPFIFPLHDYNTGDHWRLSPTAWRFLLQRSGFDTWDVQADDSRLLWDSWQYPVSVLGWAQR